MVGGISEPDPAPFAVSGETSVKMDLNLNPSPIIDDNPVDWIGIT